MSTWQCLCCARGLHPVDIAPLCLHNILDPGIWYRRRWASSPLLVASDSSASFMLCMQNNTVEFAMLGRGMLCQIEVCWSLRLAVSEYKLSVSCHTARSFLLALLVIGAVPWLPLILIGPAFTGKLW
jgi:hypothetical protein